MKKFSHGGNISEVSRLYDINSNDIIDFSSNINPLGLSTTLKNIFIKSFDNISRYPDITYFDLKNAISDYENVFIDDINLGNGASESIFNIVRAIKPKNVLLFVPTFSEYEQAVFTIDANIKYSYLYEKNNFNITSKNIDDITSDIDMIFLCNPNNPTGNLIDINILESILKKCFECNVNLVVDESFLDFVEDSYKYSCKRFLKDYDNLILVKSLTKFFAIPGLRIGYSISKNNYIVRSIENITVPWNINSIVSDLTIQCLKEKEYISKTIFYIKEQKEYLFKELKKIEDLKVFNPSANFIMFKLKKNIDLKERLLDFNILIRHCDNYEGLDATYFRVAVKNSENNKKLINIMKKIIK